MTLLTRKLSVECFFQSSVFSKRQRIGSFEIVIFDYNFIAKSSVLEFVV